MPQDNERIREVWPLELIVMTAGFMVSLALLIAALVY